MAAVIVFCVTLYANDTRKIYETERAFEKAVAEKGINAAFIEFLSPTGVMFLPDVVNAREAWRSRPASPASLTWNAVWIDISSNGALAYSIGNSRYRAKGKDDPQIFYGHYLSVWTRQPDGRYLAALDAGINHDKPPAEPADWRSPLENKTETNPDRYSAADSAVNFYQAVVSNTKKAYRSYLAEDAIVLRQGKLPAFGKRDALSLVDDSNKILFAKRKMFTEAADLGYVHAPYTMTDKKGVEVERGNFVQVWKLRNGKWLIVADVLIPLPKS